MGTLQASDYIGFPFNLLASYLQKVPIFKNNCYMKGQTPKFSKFPKSIYKFSKFPKNPQENYIYEGTNPKIFKISEIYIYDGLYISVYFFDE